ncbi:MAG: hypothetical protein GY754_05230 [bacterium]|nr:hypothetical protein [bacterium]
MRKRIQIEDLQKIAKSRGGKCLSPDYKGAGEKLKWQCGNGHTWDALVSNIKYGSWCSECSGKKKLTIEEMQQIAKDRGGVCLSKKYVNKSTKLKWQCKKGHVWEARPGNVKSGTWCPVCGIESSYTIEDMRKLAKTRGGKCLSKDYKNGTIKLEWQCRKGHTWLAGYSSVRQGSWCPVCSETLRSESRRLSMEDIHETAAKRGGVCLSKKYVDSVSKLKWQCSEGHTWEASANSVRQGSWCRKCSGRNGRKEYCVEALESMKLLARKNGGECLSKTYSTSSTKMKWQCERGHVWEAIPNSVKQGSWCRKCSGKKKA